MTVFSSSYLLWHAPARSGTLRHLQLIRLRSPNLVSTDCVLNVFGVSHADLHSTLPEKLNDRRFLQQQFFIQLKVSGN